MAQDEWITLSEAAGMIENRLDVSPGRSEAILHEARLSEEVRARQAIFFVFTDRSGCVDFRRQRPDRCPATNPDAELSKEDMLDWLGRNHPRKAATAKGKGGRPRKLDNAAVSAEVGRLMDHHDEFSSDDPDWNGLVRLYDALREKFGIELADSTLEQYVKEPIAQWRQGRRTSPKT
jgi:transposase